MAAIFLKLSWVKTWRGWVALVEPRGLWHLVVGGVSRGLWQLVVGGLMIELQ